MKRPINNDAGIAIGPILFVIALLGVLAVAMSSNMGNFNTINIADRVTTDIVSQAQLIRTKINECNLMYYGQPSNGDGYPSTDTTNGTLVSALTCAGDATGQQNLWTGARPSMLPNPTSGFNAWYFMNAGASGGRCIWTSPTASSGGIVAGLTNAAKKFTSTELSYLPASTTQKFVIFITLPTGTVNSKCTVP